MTPTQPMERLLTARCYYCGCSEAYFWSSGEELHGRPWALAQGEAAMLREGGCIRDCGCHEARHDRNAVRIVFHLGTPRAAIGGGR